MAIMELKTRERDGQVVVSLRGELDVTEAASVAAALGQVTACARLVIVDLEGLEFIDSSGLAALVRAWKHARLAGGDLLLVAPKRQALRVLAITGLTDVFSVHACVEDAAGEPGRSATAARRSRRVPSSSLCELMGASSEPGPGEAPHRRRASSFSRARPVPQI